LGFGILFLSACQNDGSDKASENTQVSASGTGLYEGPVIKFDTTAYDFGKVYEGEMVGWYFKYKNIGSKNLVLINVTASCGCTAPSYSREPLAPGKEERIKIVFDTNGRSGRQQKSINVETNGEPGRTELLITAEIIKK